MESWQKLFAHAEELEQLARPEDALAEYGDLIDANLGGVDSLIRRAFLFKALGRFQEAKQDFERAADLEPWNGWPLVRLAEMLHSIDKPWLAAACVQQALSRQPEMAEIRINAAVILMSMDWLDLAYAVVRPLPRELGDWWGNVRRRTEADYRRRRAETTAMIRSFRDAAQSDPSLREIAVALLSLGKTRVAREFCETSMRDQPAFFSDFELYAKTIARETGLIDAVCVLRAVAFLYRDNADYHQALKLMEQQLHL